MTPYQKLQDHLKSKPYTWLVTGAAGFIGSNLVESLLKLHQNVVGLDNFSTGYQHNIDQAIADAKLTSTTSHFRLIKGDISEISTCHEACIGIDFILHQAALGSVPRSIEDPVATNKANVDGFLNMLLAAKDADVKRFVYASSSSVYGDLQESPKTESRTGRPLSPYAVTKASNELYANAFAGSYGYQSIGLRYFNIFGKRQDPQGAYAAVIPLWITRLLKNEIVSINGDGSTSRDFCHVDNAVQMNLLAATTTNQEAVNQAYNVALNDNTSLNELYKLIRNKLAAIDSTHLPKEPTYRGFRTGDVLHSKADISKAQRLLGYAPTHNIDIGLDQAISWYLKNT